MINTFNKYCKSNVKKFEPYRRLIEKNEDYCSIVETYDKLVKTKSITEGLIKIKKKLKHKNKNLGFRNILEYLN